MAVLILKTVSPHPLQSLLSLVFLAIAILSGMRWYFMVVLICISLMVHNIEHLFTFLVAVCVSSLDPCPFFKLIFFHSWIVWVPYILASYHIWFVTIFTHSLGCLFICQYFSSAVQKLFSFMWSHLFSLFLSNPQPQC